MEQVEYLDIIEKNFPEIKADLNFWLKGHTKIQDRKECQHQDIA